MEIAWLINHLVANMQDAQILCIAPDRFTSKHDANTSNILTSSKLTWVLAEPIDFFLPSNHRNMVVFYDLL